jgi:predicted nucleotide-binding protein
MTRLKSRVFIGSSLETAQVIVPHIRCGLWVAQVQVWNQDDFFPPGCYVLDVLEERADDFDCAVIIFAADDTAEIKGKKCLIARDNTVLEYGFFPRALAASVHSCSYPT